VSREERGKESSEARGVLLMYSAGSYDHESSSEEGTETHWLAGGRRGKGEASFFTNEGEGSLTRVSA